MMIESFKHGCSDDGKIMVDADEYNRLQARVKELEAENAELRKFIEAKMHNLPIEDQHVASVMIQQSDDEGES